MTSRDTADGDIPLSAILTSANTHDSQAAMVLQLLEDVVALKAENAALREEIARRSPPSPPSRSCGCWNRRRTTTSNGSIELPPGAEEHANAGQYHPTDNNRRHSKPVDKCGNPKSETDRQTAR